jgi:hypothetical protein
MSVFGGEPTLITLLEKQSNLWRTILQKISACPCPLKLDHIFVPTRGESDGPEALFGRRYREAERATIDGRPAWATGAFAIAVWGRAIGCLLLLLKQSAVLYAFIASLIGVIVTMIHALGAVDWMLDFGTLMPQLMSLVVAAFLLWYSKHAAGKGWIS